MKEGDECKAVFQTNRGLFEPLVMFFGLMNSLFWDLINHGKVVIYIDNIMIFTADLAEHHKIVTEVLQILQDNKLYI